MEITPVDLLQNLILLSKSERTAFRKFLVSPFFNQQPELRNLFDFILETLPNFSKKKFTDDPQNLEFFPWKVVDVFARLYPMEVTQKEVKQQQIKLYNLCSDLNKAFENFIAASRHRKDPVRKYFYNVEYALLQNSEKLWKTAMRKLKQALSKQGDSLEFWYFQSLYLKMEFESPFFDRLHKSRALDKFEEVVAAQQIFQLLSQLVFACGVVYREEVTKNAGPDRFNKAYLDELLITTAPLAQSTHPLLHLYREVILLKRNAGDLLQFQQVFNVIQSYRQNIHSAELNELVRYLLNYCTSQSNRVGDRVFLEKRLELELWAIRQGLLLVNGVIPDVLFLNACINAAILGRFKLVDDYISNHSVKLEKKKIPFAVALARAYQYFYQQKFRLADQELIKVTIQTYQYSMLKNLLQIRVTYHLFLLDMQNQEDLMRTTLDSFRKFFHRNNYNVPTDRKNGYLNLEVLIRKIVDYLTDPHKHNDRQLHQIRKSAQVNPLALRPWAQQIVQKLLGDP